MKHATFWLSAITLPTITGVLILMGHWNKELKTSLALQNSQYQSLQAKSEKCSKKVANYVYVLDKKFYSEEGAQRIYKSCLEE